MPQAPLTTCRLNLIQPRIPASFLSDAIFRLAIQHQRCRKYQPEANHAEVDGVAGDVAGCIWGLACVSHAGRVVMCV